MRAVIQRVKEASVLINGSQRRSIERGLLILLGAGPEDTEEDIQWLSTKILQMRIFQDENQKMNLSLLDIEGDLMVISQFTLYASTKKGKRPSFNPAAPPEMAEPLYRAFVNQCQKKTVHKVQTGEFGADMQVSLTNDGPVTILIDSRKRE